MTQLTPHQSAVAAQRGKLFLEGAAGTGKTTAAVHHLLHLLESGASAGEILVLVPQRTLAAPYQHALRTGSFPAGGEVTVTTLAGIAIQMIELFWPVVAQKAGFKPETPPTFLSTETAQFIIQQVVRGLVETQGYFDGVTIERSRLYIQLLDNLNKAAVVGFPVTEIGQRLAEAWLGDPAQNVIFAQVQECSNRFRAFCVQNNLLDFSLQMEIFARQLWRLPACRDLLGQYKHLIADNVEEDNPATQDILREWLPRFETALVVYDTEAGYRRFLGADPDNGYTLRQSCKNSVEFSESFVTSPDVDALGNALARALDQYTEAAPGNALAALHYEVSRFYPDMITRVTDEVRRLVEQEGVPPGEIAILAPFLPDSLRFSLMQRLNGIPTRAHRPSRILRENPASHCLLTLAQLAHPAWGMKPDTFDVAYALMRAIGTLEPNQSLDLVRAQLLAQDGYPDENSKSGLAPFDNLPLETQERVSHVLGERYDALREWLEDYVTRTEAPPSPPAEPEPKRKGRKKKADAQVETAKATPEPELDYFFSFLFGEVLSQRGFGFHNDSAADIAWDLTDSARNFRRAIEGKGITSKPIGQAYVELVQGGIVANQYLREWQYPAPNSVFIAPANTFLLNNQPVSYQFWLDIGSRMWFERFFQPLTHPYVLSKQWTPGEKWTDEREMEMRRESLYQLALGLVRRCRVGVYLGISELGENGYENGGELLQVFSRMLRRLTAEAEGRDLV